MDRVVIITGSTRGIGFAAAQRFLKEGDKIVVLCRHRSHVINAMRRLAEGIGPDDRIIGFKCDVGSSWDVKKVIEKTLKKWDRIDILVNNAGEAIYKPLEEINVRKFKRIVSTNLKGVFLFTKQTLPAMKAQKEGVIINISSELGFRGQKNYSAYSATNFAIVGFTESMADELLDTGIKVYSLHPGGVATDMYFEMHPEARPEELIAPGQIADVIFDMAKGIKPTGSKIEV